MERSYTGLKYDEVYRAVNAILCKRDGLANPKNKQDYNIFVRELTGILCGVAYQNGVPHTEAIDFVKSIEDHVIKPIDDSGRMQQVSDLIDDDITKQRMFELTENAMMMYKPASTQVGPGEFFLCLFDRDSSFGIDNQCGYDVVVDKHTTELKRLGTNFTDPELLEHYQQSEDVQRFFVVAPVSNAAKPRIRSRYNCITFDKTHWSDVYHHTGGNGSLSIHKHLL